MAAHSTTSEMAVGVIKDVKKLERIKHEYIVDFSLNIPLPFQVVPEDFVYRNGSLKPIVYFVTLSSEIFAQFKSFPGSEQFEKCDCGLKGRPEEAVYKPKSDQDLENMVGSIYSFYVQKIAGGDEVSERMFVYDQGHIRIRKIKNWLMNLFRRK